MESGRPFPGLAAAVPAKERLAAKPFGEVLAASMDEQPPGGFLLMLVPADRPADVMDVLGIHDTEYFSDRELSAVLRSWEERFGAVVTTLGPGTAGLDVGSPPGDGEQLGRLAAELHTFAPDDWSAADLKTFLRTTRPTRGAPSAHHWAFGRPD